VAARGACAQAAMPVVGFLNSVSVHAALYDRTPDATFRYRVLT
jgi:hypothetical protein